MKKTILPLLLLSLVASSAWAVTAVKGVTKRNIAVYSLGDGEAVRLSASAKTTEGAYHALISCATSDCYWDLIDASGTTVVASGSYNIVTETAGSRPFLLLDLSPYWGIVNYGGTLTVRVLQGGSD